MKNIYFLKKKCKLNFRKLFYHCEQAIKIVFLNLFENCRHLCSYIFSHSCSHSHKHNNCSQATLEVNTKTLKTLKQRQ